MFAVLFSLANASAAPTADESMRKLARECLSPLKAKDSSKVAMTYLFHNGSKESPLSNYIKRQITTHLLREAGPNVALIDRQDFQILHQEDSFGFTFNTGDGNLNEPEAVDAILIGELITSPEARTMVICLKAIDPKTSKTLSAPVVSVELTEDLTSRLGISELDLPSLRPLPVPSSDPDAWNKDLSAAFDPRQISCSLDDSGGTDAASVLNTRLLRAYLTSELVSRGWVLLEREMFFIVAKDQAAAGEDLTSYLVADVILRLQNDATASKDMPCCFARAVQRKDGRLLGQAQIALSTSATGYAVEKHIGGDQALAEALSRTQGKLKPSKEDPLVFSASVVLTDPLTTSKEMADFFEQYRPRIFSLSGDRIVEYSSHDSDVALHLEAKSDKTKIIGETLTMLNAVEGENLEAIKADLSCFLFWGYYFQHDDKDGQRFFCHLGPLVDVVRQISDLYSLSPYGKDTTDEWTEIFATWTMFDADRHATAFTDRLLQSLNPKHRSNATRKGVVPLRFPVGSFNKEATSQHPDIHFDYNFESVWKEVFPSTLKVTIDLTPMKKSLYKVRK